MDWNLATNFAVAMLAIVNPLGKLPLWVEAAGDEDDAVQFRLAALLVGTAAVILLLFLLMGRQILTLFGIDVASFRVGGGIVIVVTGLSMLHGHVMRLEGKPPDRTLTALQRAKLRFQQVVVPLAVPMIAGPGSITTVIMFGSRVKSAFDYVILGSVLVAVLAVVLAIFAGGRRLCDLLGASVLTVFTRLFGLILTAVGSQLVLEGLGEAFPSWMDGTSQLDDDVKREPPDQTTSGGNARGGA